MQGFLRRRRKAPLGVLGVRPALAGAVGLALAGPAGAEGVPAGDWLALRAAWAAHDYAGAAPILDAALAADPADPLLLDRAAAAALAAGDLAAALPPARALEAQGVASLPGRLALLADAGRRDDWAAILAALDAGHGTGPLLDGLARGWARLGQGDPAAAAEAFEAVAARPGLRAFGLTHEALARGATGDLAGAVALLALGPEDGMQRSRRGVEALALARAGLGQGEAAQALLAETFGPAPDAAVAALRDRLADGIAPADAALVGDARAGLAEALYAIAGALSEPGDAETSLLHARAALALEPGFAEAAILAADRLRTLGQPDAAAAAYALVDPADPAFVAAETGRAAVLAGQGEGAAAVEVLAGLARLRPDLPDLAQALGDQLRAQSRFPEAEAAYGRAIALQEGAAPARLWTAHYARAVARDAHGDWPGAEADLRRALELAPGEPRILNRLGYSLVERGQALEEALGLIEAAAAADPDSGAIADSLGWALYRLGRLDEAVGTLERAAALDPADSVVNDHLGDAYWRVGRTREARFQWRRALSFDPAPEEGERLRDKLARGLDAAAPPPAQEAAAAERAGG